MNNLERLLFYYLSGRVFIPRPRFLIYNATWRCDLFCRHCGIWEAPKREELKPENLDQLLQQKFFQKVDTVWLTGGEPTFRRDLKELVQVFSHRISQMRILGIASNGYATERILSALKEIISVLNPNRHGLFIQLSLDGLNEVFDQIRGKKGAFEQLCRTVTELQLLRKKYPARKIELGFNCVVQKQNLSQLNEIKKFAKNLRASITFNVIEITDQVYRNKDRESELALTPEEKKVVRDFFQELVRDSVPGFRSHYQSVLSVLEGKNRNRRCLSLYSTLIIDSDGSWLPCPLCSEWLRKNFLEIDLEAFWRGEEANALREKVTRELCPSCKLSCSLGDSLSLGEFLAGGF